MATTLRLALLALFAIFVAAIVRRRSPGMTPRRKLALTLGLCWALASFAFLDLAFGGVVSISKWHVLAYGVGALAGALSSGAVVVELMRCVVPAWAPWSDKRHFGAVLVVAGVCLLLQMLFFVFALHSDHVPAV